MTKHLKRLATGIDVAAALAELRDFAEADRVAGRAYIKAPDDVYLRQPHRNPEPPTICLADPDFRPEMRRLLDECLTIIGRGEFLSAIVRIMGPGDHHKPHRDNLRPSHKRYQLMMANPGRARFKLGSETRVFEPGELWLTDIANRTHSVRNGEGERVAMVINIISGRRARVESQVLTAEEPMATSVQMAHFPVTGSMLRN